MDTNWPISNYHIISISLQQNSKKNLLLCSVFLKMKAASKKTYVTYIHFLWIQKHIKLKSKLTLGKLINELVKIIQ